MKKLMTALLFASPLITMAQSGKFVIDGKIISDTLTTGKVYLNYEDNNQNLRDSSSVINNTYHFEGTMKDGGIQVNLYLKDSLMSRAFKGFAQFDVQPGHVYVTHKSNFVRTNITGSLLQQQADSLDVQRKDARVNHTGTDKDVDVHFIKNHPDSWLSYTILSTHLIRNNDLSLDEADALYAVLSPRLKNYDTVKSLKALIDGKRMAVVGKPAIDFTEKDINGKSISLSSYRGKYVLVDFWASWCHPCRAENPNVTAAYHKFKDKGLNILSVSLDGDRKRWLEAVKHDKLEWTQVSNLEAFEDEVAVKYGIHAIPANFLISPDGIIVAKDLRGEELDKELTKIFSK
ncbi:hypothetical protein A9P82_04750 [Arachidicoccus ginsenosidimutans]|uniref:TlpA disulfide reductase family protein n=1 Tax=Arachidicoccus sp. BS20 TaxID=1850526 RepID=UPI0007F138B3|nr:TlpA disulfide reductase family protein [Arachidicoccus sp. BS20]ANI88655.1 hypothetical protein A9P82_04750 [Arachidicoccus sp. BS20]